MIEGNPSYQRLAPQLDPRALRRVPPGARQIVVPLEKAGGRSGPNGVLTTRWTASPLLRFLPLGLLVFDAGPDARVHGVRVGNQSEAISDNYTGVPARYFESNRTFEQILALAAAGELPEALPDRLLLELSLCEMGCQVGVETSGLLGAVCLWGLTSDGWQPRRDVRIWRETHSDRDPSYRAEVVDQTLVGDRLRFGANTETEGAAVELVKAYFSGGYH